MNQSIMAALGVDKLDPEVQAFIDGLPSTAGFADMYNRAPNGAWIVWGCSKRPATPERVRRLVSVAALFARAVLPLVREQDRAMCEESIRFTEAVGRGEAIDRAAADVAAYATARASDDAARASDDAGVAADAAAAITTTTTTTIAAAWAAWFAARAAVTAAPCVVIPSADDVRAALGAANDWL